MLLWQFKKNEGFLHHGNNYHGAEIGTVVTMETSVEAGLGMVLTR